MRVSYGAPVDVEKVLAWSSRRFWNRLARNLVYLVRGCGLRSDFREGYMRQGCKQIFLRGIY
jgi:hypothetical protein